MKQDNIRAFPARINWLGVALIALVSLAGCEEANIAIDNLLGRKAPVLASASDGASQPGLLAKKTPPGAMPPAPAPQPAQPGQPAQPAEEGKAPEQPKPQPPSARPPAPAAPPAPGVAQPPPPAAPPAPPVAKPPTPPAAPPPAAKKPEPPAPPTVQVEPAAHLASGRRRPPGHPAPRKKDDIPGLPAPIEVPVTIFEVSRDPFKAPTEILPSECPPSMPLCKFDRSQLKLVGVIQVEEGNFKGMVEDPDGRGYFVTSGMQIGGATVTQVSQKGLTLHLSRTGQDVVIPLFLGAKGTQDF